MDWMLMRAQLLIKTQEMKASKHTSHLSTFGFGEILNTSCGEVPEGAKLNSVFSHLLSEVRSTGGLRPDIASGAVEICVMPACR